MEIKIKQISEILGGELEGDGEVSINSISKIEEGKPGSISFLANPKYKHYIYTTEVSVVLVEKDFEVDREIKTSLIRVENPYASFVKLLDYYQRMKEGMKVGVDKNSSISERAKMGKGVFVGAFSVIEDGAEIGDNVKIYSNVYVGEGVKIGAGTIIRSGVNIYADCVIGENCLLHSGVVIGADGFGFMPEADGKYHKVPQIGNVVIENNVEIGANTTIDRATMGSTRIREGVKLDNLVQIAHNVEVGANTVIASQTGIAGSTKVGEGCIIGGQVGIAGHLTVGNGVRIQAQTGVARNIEDKEVLQGTPALKYSEYNRAYVIFRKLPDMFRRLENLEKKDK